MKSFILFFLLLPTILFSQDLKEKVKEQAEEIVYLKSRNQKLIVDSFQHDITIHNLKRAYDFKIKQLEYDIITLKWQQKKLNLQLDTLNKIKSDLTEITKMGAIVYFLDNDPSTIFYIDLSKYNFEMLNNGLIKLLPIYEPEKWRKFKAYGYPSPDNLSIHFYPYDIYGDKINFYKN